MEAGNDVEASRWIRKFRLSRHDRRGRPAAPLVCFNVKASATPGIIDVRANPRGRRGRAGVRARARDRTSGAGCSPYPAPTRIESNSSARVGYPRKVTNARGPIPTFPSPLPAPLSLCHASRPVSTLAPSPSRFPLPSRLPAFTLPLHVASLSPSCSLPLPPLRGGSAIKRRPRDRTRKSSTTAAQMNGMPTHACPARPSDRLSSPLARGKRERGRTNGWVSEGERERTESSRARWTEGRRFA